MTDATDTVPERRIVFIAGSGRSGTSLMAGILRELGFYVPQPEVTADPTNPKGFAEPQWAVDYHARLLRVARVHPSDARPSAWFETGRFLNRLRARTTLERWLGEQLEISADLVLKDPRLIWFLPIWQQCATDLGARTSVVTMLRDPTEVVASKERSYGGRLTSTSRTAGWLNLMFYTERSTRDANRAFVHYADLLEDWTSVVADMGDRLNQPVIIGASSAAMRAAHHFVDPGLRRSVSGWDDLGVPPRLRELADEVSTALDRLADDPSDLAAQQRMDAARIDYAALYEEAEGIALSSILAAGPPNVRRRPDGQPVPDPPGSDPVTDDLLESDDKPSSPDGAAPSGSPTSAGPRRAIDRFVHKVPHRYRERIPVGLRSKLRRDGGRAESEDR